MSNIIDSIRLSGTVYTIAGGSGGNPTVELTQAEYDDLVSAGTVSPTTYYIITDAQPTDISLYWTSAQTQSAITQAVSGKADTSSVYTKSETSGATEIATALNDKQDTLSAGTNITIVDNVISATGGGGGGTTYTAGRGIDITNDTISFNLPISAYTNGNVIIGTSHNTVPYGQYGAFVWGGSPMYSSSGNRAKFCSQAGGWGCSALGEYTLAVGHSNSALTDFSVALNYENATSNKHETALGRYNNSVSASTTFGDSGNTLFSVGNGTGNDARHNAFEIRQNGDIYITSGGTDILLQDNLGGGGGGGSITVDSTLDSGSTNPVANSAITKTLGKYYYARKINKSPYASPWGSMSSNGCVAFTLGFANIVNPDESVSSPLWLSTINGKSLFSINATAPNANYFNLSLVETSAVTSAVTSASTNSEIPTAKAVYDQLGGLKLVKITAADYANITPDENTVYFVGDSNGYTMKLGSVNIS